MGVTAKEIYQAYSGDPPPARVEYRPELSVLSGQQWEYLWARVSSKVLEPVDREVVWRLVHNILPTRERLARLGVVDLTAVDGRRVTSADCNRCNLGQRDTVTHMFTECGLVREAWMWVRRRMLMMLPGDMAGLSNFEFCHMLFPRGMWEVQLTWMVGTFMGWVYMESVVRGRMVSDKQVRGYMRYKFNECLRKKMPEIGYIPEFFREEDIVFDNG